MTFGKRKYGWLFCLVVVLGILVVSYRYSSKRLELFGHYEKVWAHRVNDLPKLESAENKFAGVEIDLLLVPEKNQLIVHHPNIPSPRLDFKAYLNHVENPDLGLWLDIKNLNEQNAAGIYELLEKGIDESPFGNRKKDVLVESADAGSLEIFLKEGYRVSLYLPFGTKDEKNKDSLVATLKERLQKHKGLELSAHYSNYPFLHKYFPGTIKNLWFLTSTYDPEIIANFSMTRQLLNDKTVKTVLIPYINFNRHFTKE